MSAPGFEYKGPYRMNTYMGAHVDDAAALTYIRAQKWDSAKDGTGFPEEGMWYFDETLHAPKHWDANAGGWIVTGTAGQLFALDTDFEFSVGNTQHSLLYAAGKRLKRIRNSGSHAVVSLSGLQTTPHPPPDGTLLIVIVDPNSSTDIVVQHEDTNVAAANQRLDLSVLPSSPTSISVDQTQQLYAQFLYFNSRWRALSFSHLGV